MSKEYSFIELLTSIKNGEIKEGAGFYINGKQDVIWEYNGYDIVNSDNETLHDIYTLEFILEFKFELIEENTIDEIEELNNLVDLIPQSDNENLLLEFIRTNKSKINELVRVVNKLIKENKK